MVHLTGRQREVLLSALPNTANVAAGGLVFGQFVSGRPFSLVAVGVGIAIWLVFLGVSLTIAGSAS
jgi:predicted acyltransferase